MFGSNWHVCADPEVALERDAFSSLDAIWALRGQRITEGRFCQVIRVALGDRHYYVKRYAPTPKRRWKRLWRSRPHREAQNLMYFERIGLPSLRVVAYGDQRTCSVFRRGALVTAELPDALDLEQLVARKDPMLEDPRVWRSIQDQVADAARHLHAGHFVHRDLRWRNLLVRRGPEPVVHLMDAPLGRKPPRFLWRRALVKELAALDRLAAENLSRTARLRFLLRYMKARHVGAAERRLAREVLARGRRRRPYGERVVPGTRAAPRATEDRAGLAVR